MNHFASTFAAFACLGDTVTATVDGFDITARLEFDQDTRPDDFDCYDAETIQAWRDDEWMFVGIVVEVARNGITLDDHAASLWGVDCNFPGSDNAYLTEVANELVDEALERARETLAKLCDCVAA